MELCEQEAVRAILYFVGIIIFAIKIAVPIILIVMGMVDLVKAVAGQNEDELKKATSKLVKKAVAAVAVFLVATIVAMLMGLIGANQYEDNGCMQCVKNPFTAGCKPNLGG